MAETKKIVIIGGGLGGMSAAISLRQQGYDVAIYEKNRHLGGKLNRLEQDGFGFDLGPSILTMPAIFERLFENSAKQMSDYVTIVKLGQQWRTFFPDDTSIDLYENLDDLERFNPSLSPKDIEEYKALLSYSKKLYDVTEKGYFNEGLDNLKDVLKHHGVIESLQKFDLSSTMFEAIDRRISNRKFRDMLSYIVKYVGSSAYHAPAVLNMMLYMQHDQGLWYVKGGLHKLGEAIRKLAEEIGVNIYLGHEIVRLETKKKQITAAFLDNGEKIEADYFVSNMEVIPTYRKLLNEDEKYVDKLDKKFEPASSGLVMHLGVKKQYPQLAHHNFFFSSNPKRQMKLIFDKHELPDDPVIYVVNVNKTDPSQTLPGHENIKVLPHIPHLGGKTYTREQYEAFAERVLEKMERMGLEGLRDHIVVKDMWTPHDIERTYNSDRGAIYGTVSDKEMNKGFKHPKQSERYNNLYFVGGTTNPGGGMPMVTLSGQQVAKKIADRDGL